ncbi:hypothetical protein Tco_1080183 [Tanacetum coccineum]|uniref:Uncharacterized protein n=1 Tax=Tanacetum coccineum TaxID=301880 RepID=A0ABQ5HU00_9ASTR
MMDLAVQFDNASAAKQDLRQAYEKCNDIPQETRNLIDAFLKRESDKDYEMNLAMYRKAGKIEKQIEAKYVWLSENTNSFHSPTINTNSFHKFFSHIQTTFQKLTMSETNQSNPSAPEKPTEPILQQPYTTPNHDSETHKGGSSSEQNTHKPTSPITHGFLTEKEYQQGRTYWTSIVHEVRVLQGRGINVADYIRLKLGNGENTRFWVDKWYEDGVIKELFPRMFALELNKNATVSSKLNASSLDNSFRRKARSGIEKMQLNSLVVISRMTTLVPCEDRYVWTLESDGGLFGGFNSKGD